MERSRFRAGVWQEGEGAWLDLGPAVPGIWQHVAVSYDGAVPFLAGYVDGELLGSTEAHVPDSYEVGPGETALGGVAKGSRLGGTQVLAPGKAAYSGLIDEIHRFTRAIDETTVALLAMRRPPAAP